MFSKPCLQQRTSRTLGEVSSLALSSLHQQILITNLQMLPAMTVSGFVFDKASSYLRKILIQNVPLRSLSTYIHRTDRQFIFQKTYNFRTYLIFPLLYCCQECKMVQLLWKTVRRFLKTLKIGLPSDPAILLLCIYPKEMK